MADRVRSVHGLAGSAVFAPLQSHTRVVDNVPITSIYAFSPASLSLIDLSCLHRSRCREAATAGIYSGHCRCQCTSINASANSASSLLSFSASSPLLQTLPAKHHRPPNLTRRTRISYLPFHADTQILYSLPIGADKMEDLTAAQEKCGSKATIRVMVDHAEQIALLAAAHKRLQRRVPWSAFLKVDGGGRRAGAPPRSQQMRELIEAAVGADEVEIYGFYSRECTVAPWGDRGQRSSHRRSWGLREDGMASETADSQVFWGWGIDAWASFGALVQCERILCSVH